MEYFIGIDLGTSAVKMLLTDGDGVILCETSRTYKLYNPKPNYSEQDPEEWWSAVCDGLNSLITNIDKRLIKGIGVGGQMHGLVMLDRLDRVLRPAILWNDTRTGKETDYLNNVVGREKLRKLTDNIAFAGFTAPKVLWVKENEPELFAACAKICLPKDYINYKLTGVFATDVSDASGTLYFDVEKRCWSTEMLNLLGIKEQQLPKVFESGEKIGKTELFGLNCEVVAGAGDNAAAAIGAGTTVEGQCNISLGTSGTVFIPTENAAKPDNPAIHSFCHANGKYHLLGCILSAAGCNKWLNEIVFESDYNVSVDDTELNDLFFLPYMSGERCPHNDGDAKGAFVGLTHSTSRADMQRAVFEGISFAIKDCIALCPYAVESATVCGGGTKSKTWMRILSNVLNVKLYVIRNEGPAYGAALLAAGICGKPHIEYSVTPNAKIAEKYAEKYQKYTRLYPALQEFFKL